MSGESSPTESLFEGRSPFGLHSLSVEALIRVRLVYLRRIEDFIAGRIGIVGREAEYTQLLRELDEANAECLRRRDLILRFA